VPPPGVSDLLPVGLGEVCAFDRQVFGADRRAVLEWAQAAAPGLARVAREGSRVRGYCFGRHGDHSDHVGPVVAEDRDTARDLVLACLAGPLGRPLILDARAAPDWLTALSSLGFRDERPFTRMYLGDARPGARPALEAAVFGPEFG
jgi:hypothetical protein